MAKVDLSEILNLPLEERIDVVQEIWDSVAADTDAVPLTPEQAEELDRRLEEHERNPDDVVEWSVAEKRIRDSLKQ
ncbi:MAG: addiction module protein [Spirochaetaceae bacterium]